MLAVGWYFLIMAMVVLTVSRVCLCLWLRERVRAAGGWWPVLKGGWRIDASFLAMVAGIPLLLAPWVDPFEPARWLALAWFGAWSLVLVLLEIATPQFIIEYDSRPNRLFVAYLTQPREVASMLWRGYKPVLLAGVLLWLVAGAGVIAWLNSAPVWLVSASWWQRLALMAGLFVVLLLVGRGSLGHRPLNAAQVAFCGDAMVNMLPLNSTFVVVNAIKDQRTDRPAAAVYGAMDEARMQALVRTASGLGPPTAADPPTQNLRPATATPPRARNIVIIVEESLGAQFTGCLGGSDCTPELDALAGQGWLLARLFATGTRSVRGLEAVTAGFLPTPADAVFKLPRSQRDFFTLAALLGRHGYHSRFVYGGEAHFDNMKGFFLGNGFDEVVDLPKFQHKPVFTGSWGACDEDLFDELHQRLSDDGDTSTLTVAFTVSNHSPWEYPAGRIMPQGEPASVENTVRYADWALGRFFERARQSTYWDDTVFAVVADHDARVVGASLVPVARFHIPALLLGAGIEPRRDEGVCSQVDLAPTLLSLAGISAMHPMPGADLTRHAPDRAIMQYGANYGYLSGGHLLVLEPQRPARQFAWPTAGSPDAMQAEALDPALAEVALAHALWPGWAYFNEFYRLPRVPEVQPTVGAVLTTQPQG